MEKSQLSYTQAHLKFPAKHIKVSKQSIASKTLNKLINF